MKHKITVHTSNTQIKIKEKNSTINPQRKKKSNQPKQICEPQTFEFSLFLSKVR